MTEAGLAKLGKVSTLNESFYNFFRRDSNQGHLSLKRKCSHLCYAAPKIWKFSKWFHSWSQVTINAQNVPLGPEDLHPRDAQAADDAEAQLHPKVLVGPATAPQREDQPDRQHLWRSKLVRLLSAKSKS